MIEDTLIDDQSLEIDIYKEVITKNKTYTLRVLSLILIITILYPISMIDENLSNLERVIDALIYTLLVIPFLGFIFSIPIALYPYKGLFFHQKYIRAFLLTLLFLNTAFIILLIFIGLFA